MHFHNNVKHLCDVCGKEFGSKSDMERHVRQVHWKIKGLPPSAKCEECGKAFAFKSDALRHMRTVHLNTDQICPSHICSGKHSMLTSYRRIVFKLQRLILLSYPISFMLIV